MRKANKIMMMTVSILLSFVLITSSVMSSTLAKYVTTGSASSSTARVAKWGITIEGGTDLATKYTQIEGDTYKVQSSSSSNVIAPGTRGALVWFRVSGTPEVAYSLDFSGSIDIGDGYTNYIKDADGNAIEYFPITLRCTAYDVIKVDGKELFSEVDALTSDPICLKRIDKDANKTKNYFAISLFDSITALESFMNGEFGINSLLDDPFKNPATSIDRIYALEWEWLYHYDTVEEVAAGKTDNNRDDTASGNYQTRELDTQLGEAVNENPGMFDITVNMDVVIEQVQGK